MTEWYFKCQMSDGAIQSFDGVTPIVWESDDRISFLKEFSCNINNYDPYRNGDKPEFRDENMIMVLEKGVLNGSI